MANPGTPIGPRALLLFTEAWFTLLWIDLGIRLLPFRLWRRWLEPAGAAGEGADGAAVPALVTATERAARHHLLPMNCLRRSLGLRRLLRRRGVPERLHLGVRRGEAGLEAHAWLSSGGRILNDSPDVTRRYAELRGDPARVLRHFDS